MGADPGSEFVFLHVARGNGEHSQGGIRLLGAKAIAIQVEKQTHRQKRSTLVTVNERMVLCEPDAIARGQVGEIRRAAVDGVEDVRGAGVAVVVSLLAMVSVDVVAGVQADSMAEPAINRAILRFMGGYPLKTVLRG